MTSRVRIVFARTVGSVVVAPVRRVTLVLLAPFFLVLAISAAPAQGAFGIHGFFANTCLTNVNCTSTNIYTTADGHPNYGITETTFNTEPDKTALSTVLVAEGKQSQVKPVGNVKDTRTDLPPGLDTNPLAVPRCDISAFNLNGKGAGCPANTAVGVNNLTLYGNPPGNEGYEKVCKPLKLPESECYVDFPLQATVYNLNPAQYASYGLSSPLPLLFGFEKGNQPLGLLLGYTTGSGDYHQYFITPNISKSPYQLIASQLVINGKAGAGVLTLPTACKGVLTTTIGAEPYEGAPAASLYTTPTAVTGCSSLAFKPRFRVFSNARTSRAHGASLTVKIGYPKGSQANIRSVWVRMPEALPSRLSTLKRACLEATFKANPFSCPSNSHVGGVTVTTPELPVKLTGPAIFVSHGGAAFPDLDLVLKGDGVLMVLVGNTRIRHGITTTNFAALPDERVSSFELRLPIGPNSALAAPRGLCGRPLIMPTRIVGQNGKVIKQRTRILVRGCRRG